MVYYNEFDPYAAQWLRNLIAAGLIPAGDVDDRDIRNVKPGDLNGYEQCHFFAGIAGWPYALDLAGWGTRPVWTASCPCQPFSAAGKRKGTADDRHLWPEFLRLIAACKPATVFGEQVASKDGREWLAGVRTDLEALGYEVGAADLCAASVGAPHIRQRLFWVADANGGNAGAKRQQRGRQQRQFAADGAALERLADDSGPRLEKRERDRCLQSEARQPLAREASELYRDDGRLADAEDANGRTEQQAQRARRGRDGFAGSGEAGGLGITDSVGSFPRQQTGSSLGHWNSFDATSCSDGKSRRTEPGVQPLAHGVSNRVGKLRAYGNAIVPQVAAEFVKAFREAA